jgi:DNA-binding response OmpR family regulator
MAPAPTILIADRNRNIREFLRRELGAEGYTIFLASDGKELLELLGTGSLVNLLVMDLILPFVDGLTVLHKLQVRKDRPPVVVFTSLSEYRDDPMVKTAAAFLEKEEGVNRLKATIREVLARGEAAAGTDAGRGRE